MIALYFFEHTTELSLKPVCGSCLYPSPDVTRYSLVLRAVPKHYIAHLVEDEEKAIPAGALRHVSLKLLYQGGSSFRCHCPLSGVNVVVVAAISANSSDTVGAGLVPASTSPSIS